MGDSILTRARELAREYRLRRRARVGVEPRIRGRLWIHGEGRIELGDRVILDAAAAPIELHVAKGAVISVGDDVYVGGGSSIEAQCAVTIGARSRLGRFAKVIDNHFHSVVGNRTQRPPSVPVVIEEDVELGARAIVLPGAHLGCGCRVAPGTVITRRIPPHSLAAGVPAVVRPLGDAPPAMVDGAQPSGAKT
jgi:acetyltransferase-like isoleucine patch superfamily enzyme